MRFENGSTTLELSYKVKHIPTLWPRNFFPKYSPKRNEKICPQKDLYKNFHSNLIHSSPKLETTQKSINSGMGKEIAILRWKKKECYTDKSNNTDECQKHYIQQKKADTRVAFHSYEDSRIVKTNLWWQESEQWLSVVEYN